MMTSLTAALNITDRDKGLLVQSATDITFCSGWLVNSANGSKAAFTALEELTLSVIMLYVYFVFVCCMCSNIMCTIYCHYV